MRRAAYGPLGILIAAGWWLFTASTASGQGWKGPEAIDSGLRLTWFPQIAQDESGRAVAVFLAQSVEMAPTRSYANVWDGSSWASATDITPGISPDSRGPAVAMDGSGNAIAVFEQIEGFDYHVYFNHWDGTAWATASSFGISAVDTLSPAVAMDGSGNAIAVFKTDDTYDRIYASYWSGSDWIQRAIISELNNNADSPEVAMDESGNAIAVFLQYGTPDRICANHWNGVGWNGLTTIDMGWGNDALDPSVEMDGSGNAVAVFVQYDGEDDRACANYWNGSSWSIATTIDTGPGNAVDSVRVALNGSGAAVAAFMQQSGVEWHICANSWDGSSWSGAVRIDAGTGGNAYSPDVALDEAGRAIAVFNQSAGSDIRTYANKWDGSSWSGATTIDTGPGNDARHPHIAMDGSGHAVAVFEETDGSETHIYANRYVFPPRPSSSWNYDYNGDGTSDIAIFRDSAGLWAVRGLTRVYFGSSGDLPVPGDYDGDGTTDIAVFRRSSGLWAVRDGARAYFGASSDTPLPRDYNGDGTSEIAIFRPASGLWAIRGATRAYYGGSGDTPLPGDYRGYGAADIGIFREATGLWAARGLSRSYFGGSGDLPVPAQYASDPGLKPAIFRPSTGLWAVITGVRNYFGTAGDTPVPADYDGDGIARIGIFRPATGLWALRDLPRVYFGGTGDIPVAR